MPQELHPQCLIKVYSSGYQRETSYYYAHAKKEGTSEANAGGGIQEPKLLSTSKSDEKTPLERISKFSWSDEGADVKIYIFFCNLGPASVANDNVPLR